MGQEVIATILAKEEVRKLAQLYSRGVNLRDPALLRTLYTADGMDYHGDKFRGPAEDYIQTLELSMPHLDHSGHHICNHLISVDGDEGYGEVCALACHIYQNGKGGYVEDLQTVHYLDHYRRMDRRWKFALRNVIFDAASGQPSQARAGLPGAGGG
jgi:hypothetical protein